MTAIGYARVSTDEQCVDLQYDALKAAGCETILCDEGVSGAVRRRPALDEALRIAKAGDVFIVWRLDRLGRSLSQLINLTAHFEAEGIGFRSISESIDTTSPGGRLLFHVMGALAEFERALIAERTKAGMAAARARGTHVGRPYSLSVEDRSAIRLKMRCGARAQDLATAYDVSLSAIYRAAKAEPVIPNAH
ncbi:recombinase family protein [Woodsholea maritima]|uniref:recombinase family protein n=1 Tax=Woodsholea maritima TaxID=240237 RepID=UPI000377EA78|nr:recombinase family protein [Woodsholea maritima]